jgi:peptide/nickel transport system ATP-binding protein
MDEPLLQVSDLSVRFETEEGPVHAVDRLSFTLGRGEVLGIVGESGCGKSASCLALVRLLPDTAKISGRAELAGVDLLSLSKRDLRKVRARDVSYVFQEPLTALNPVLSIGSQIGEVLTSTVGLSRRDARDRTVELLRLVQIPAPERRIDAYPHQLSGGMRQRVVIAIALACEPKVLIADEPTTALDVTIQAGILDLLGEIRDRLGTAIILITHNLGVVADIADRVLVMYAGRNAEEADVHDLFAEPQHPYTVSLLAAVPRVDDTVAERGRLHEIPGRIPTLRELPDGCAFAPRCTRADGANCIHLPELRLVRDDHRVACWHPGAAA